MKIIKQHEGYQLILAEKMSKELMLINDDGTPLKCYNHYLIGQQLMAAIAYNLKKLLRLMAKNENMLHRQVENFIYHLN